MKSRILIALSFLVCCAAWLTSAASQPQAYTISRIGVVDQLDEGWATIQTDDGQEWLLPLDADGLVEGGVFQITVSMLHDEKLHKQVQTKVARLLLALIQ